MSVFRTRATSRSGRVAGASVALFAGAGLALAAPLSASAHVSASASSTAAGSYTVLSFSVPHGCEASPTEIVTISIPESVPSVTPTVNPNWTVEKVSGDAADPDRVTEVVYTAIDEPLASDLRDVFELSFRVPDGTEGERLEFPTVQTCTEGTAEWAGEDAPAFDDTAAVADAHGGSAAHSDPSETDAGEVDAVAAGTSDASGAATAAGSDDGLARVLGGAGLALGAGALGVSLVSARRTRSTNQ